MKFISLFAGIGGFDLAFERAGMISDSVCEIDRDAQAVLKRHFPNSKLFDDVKQIGVTTHARGTIDLICGGFPCQDVSVAGKRAGLAGERSGLWFEFARIIDELEPRWVVIENVPGLLSSNNGRDFGTIIRWLAERGYGVCWRVLDTQYFGVPQRRRRVFIVGSLGSGHSAKVLFEREGVSGDTPPRRETREVSAFLAGQGSAAGGLGYREEQSPTLKGSPSGSNQVPTIVQPLRAGRQYSDMGDGKTNVVVGTLPASGAGLNRPARQGNELDFLIPQVFQQNTRDEVRLLGGEGQYAGALSSQPGMKQQNYIVFDANRDGLTSDDNITPTLKHGGDGEKAHNAYAKLSIAQTQGVRRLTPTECERLQGFPDGWTEGQSDSARYRQLGNAVAVPVVEWIGRRIMKVENG